MPGGLKGAFPGAETALRGVLGFFLPVLAVLWVGRLPERFGLLIFPEQLVALMFGLGMAVSFLKFRADGTARLGAPFYDWLFAGASLAIGFWLVLRLPVLLENSHAHPREAGLIGLVILILIVEGLRRLVGWSLVVVLAIFVLYGLFAHFVPGRLQGKPLELSELLAFLGTDGTAVLGGPLLIACTVIAIFVLFGQLLLAAGSGEVFTAIAGAIAGRGKGGAAKVAVVGSSFFGMISGSAVSNVMTTGVVTIPLMKRNGYSSHKAGAIEAVASTGGQIMPPVMGAAAFIMAEFLRLPYRDIALAAAVPALLYYLCVYTQIHLLASKLNLPRLEEAHGKPITRMPKATAIVVLAFATLILGMFLMAMSAERAAALAVLVIAAFAGIVGSESGRLSLRRLAQEVAKAGEGLGDVIAVCAAAGVIIGLLQKTGLGFGLSFVLLELGEKNLFALLLVTAFVCLVLGMGMPTTGVYLLLAALAAPSLAKLGVPPLAAHMFVFYYGMLSMVTPPVAMAAYAGASIAGADPMRTGWHAVTFCWVAFVVPFLFVYQPGLLLIGSAGSIALAFASSVMAILFISAAIVGQGFRLLKVWERALAAAIGAMVLLPLERFFGVAGEIATIMLGALALAQHAAFSRRR